MNGWAKVVPRASCAMWLFMGSVVIPGTGCSDYQVAQKVRLFNGPSEDHASCVTLDKGKEVDCVDGKAEHGCKEATDTPDGRWNKVKWEGKECWVRLDAFDKNGPLTLMNERIANIASYKRFKELTDRARRHKEDGEHEKCTSTYLKASKLTRHPKHKDAIKEAHTCELTGLRFTLYHRVTRQYQKYENNEKNIEWMLARCRNNSARIRRALVLEQKLEEKGHDTRVEAALRICTRTFVRKYIRWLQTARERRPRRRRYYRSSAYRRSRAYHTLRLLKQERAQCAPDLAAVTPEGFRETLGSQFQNAEQYGRNPMRLYYRVSTILPIMRWIEKPDRLEVEIRYGDNLTTVQNSKDSQLMWSVVTLKYCNSSWHVDDENPYLTSW